MTHSLSLTLAHYAATTSIANVPSEVRERAKQVILDEIASAHFGRRSMGGDLAARYVSTLGGPQEALILGTSQRVPAPHAAMANGAAGHGEEVDGAHVIGGHPGATLVHAAVAIAERQRASGAELVNAVVLAYDVGIRLVEACGGKFGSNVTITTVDGVKLSRRVEHPRGHSLRGGVTWSDLAAKWRDGLPDCDVDRMITLASRLEDREDVRELSDAFRVTAR